MSFRPNKSAPKPKTPVKRYRAGQVPENYVDELSESEEEEEQQQELQQPVRAELHFAQKEIQTGIKQTTISEKDASTDRRLRRLQQLQLDDQQDRSARRRHVQEDEEEDEEEQARERMRLKQKALMQQQDITQQEEEEEEVEEQQGSEEEEGSSSEYESSSEEEDTLSRLPKPVFIPKAKRETILEQEKLAKEREEREKRLEEELEERKKQSHTMLADELKREQEELLAKDLTEHEDMPDDTDGLDEEAEYEAWKLRELARIKRDREARITREKEEEELERRRALPEEVRLKEDLERAKESAFYHNPDDEIFQRDYSAPTVDEVRNKELLPKVMQVKNFGLAGRTKYTHLVDQDTSSKDSPWAKPLAKRRRHNYEG
ncbi:hypothetical protein G6F37_009584 [Rhizopus arrhizus]|nr:hypothetical protein G6F38_001722 [Rhizopus arrhizus]KAG1154289.1 hypothetical protein G6F37_009584 [Rhizopus arrhizus]